MKLRIPFGSLGRFAVVGLLATALYSAVYAALAETGLLTAGWANLVAYPVGIMTSYIGHTRWTFGVQSSATNFSRFVATAALGLMANAGFVYLLVDVWGQRPAAAIPFFVFVTPLLTFAMLKLWAFRD